MFLNHLDLQVADVQKVASFLETFFGFTLTTSRNSPAIAVMRGEHDVIVVLQRHATPVYPDGFHFGFLVDTVATVEAKHRALTDAGIDVSPIDVNARGTMIYCRFDSLLVEVSCRKKPLT